MQLLTKIRATNRSKVETSGRPLSKIAFWRWSRSALSVLYIKRISISLEDEVAAHVHLVSHSCCESRGIVDSVIYEERVIGVYVCMYKEDNAEGCLTLLFGRSGLSFPLSSSLDARALYICAQRTYMSMMTSDTAYKQYHNEESSRAKSYNVRVSLSYILIPINIEYSCENVYGSRSGRVTSFE